MLYNAVMKALLALAIILSVIGAYTLGYCSNLQTVAEPPVSVPLDADIIFDLVNRERTARGLEPLRRSLTLDSTAYLKTQDMVQYDYFAHEREGEKILDKVRKIMPECVTASENLAISNETEEIVVSGWLNSETHREIMLNPEHELSGVSVAVDYTAEYGIATLITQHFCNL